MPAPCDTSMARREASTWRQKHRTLQWLFPRQSCLRVRQSCMLGATSLSKIFIPLFFFPPPHLNTRFSRRCLHHCCSMLLLCMSCNGAKQEATSEIIIFLHQNELFLLLLPPPGPEDLALTSPHIHLSARWARRKPSSPKSRQASDKTKLKIHIFQTKVQSPNGKRIQEKCSRPGWWPASSTSTSLRRNPARSLN